jgi:hypothetical protein
MFLELCLEKQNATWWEKLGNDHFRVGTFVIEALRSNYGRHFY